jgi:CRISPR type I-E-associated protein CasA/Cse1
MITHKWIPTDVGLIAPHEIVRDIHLLAPRADFNAALLQFLIGLVQTTMAPQNERAWKNIYKNPPSESDLQAAFAPLISTFDYKIFMQDFAEFDGKTNNISGLLPETPGDQTCRLDTDFFVKRDTVKHLCKSCTATALLSHNLNASSDGVGYRTGLRGGGPLTTIAIGDTLWETIWLNILETPDLGDSESDEIFPWMCPTHTAEVHSAEVNPLLIIGRCHDAFILIGIQQCILHVISADKWTTALQSIAPKIMVIIIKDLGDIHYRRTIHIKRKHFQYMQIPAASHTNIGWAYYMPIRLLVIKQR